MANKRKATTAIVAGVTAAALLLGGTFAWISISQQARNEVIVDINPGGRLHDDFDGKNKDVYVENFSSGATGVDIFARIRLDQYFEVGQDAGINKDGTARKVNQILGTDINDVKTWETYKPIVNDGETLDFSALQANGNWQWTLGNGEDNLPYYMPTFNMNKDSLAADINGTYEGKTEGDIVYYDDYIKYGSADEAAADPNNIVNTEDGTEVYDHDEDTAEEDGNTVAWDNGGITTDESTPIDSADVYHKENQTHTAEQISSTATVITMAQWIAEGSQTGAFWVYDTDGWAYWAQPIKPGETTGLLLDSIQMSRVPDDNYYYGINVVGQFATKGDIYQFDGMSPEAEALFVKLTGSEEITITGADTVLPGGTVTYTATRMALGGEAVSQPEFVWSVDAADGVTMDNGTLTVGADVAPGTKITVTATASDAAALAEGDATALSASKTVTVVGTVDIAAANGTTRYLPGEELNETFTVMLDGTPVTDGSFTWAVTDSEGNALTETAIDKNGSLTVGAGETAYKLIVTATCTPAGSSGVYIGTYEILNINEIVTTDDTATAAYAIMTDDGSGNGTYAMTFIRSNETPTTDNTYQGETIANVYSSVENSESYYPSWRNEKNVTSVSFANPIAPISMQNWFNGFTALKSVDFTNLDGSKIQSMLGVFSGATAIEYIDMSGVVVSKDNQINVMDMFQGCTSLLECRVPENMTVVTGSTVMRTFSECHSLTAITGIETWDVSNVSTFYCMFNRCYKLKNIDLSGWKFGDQASLQFMFTLCESLEQIEGAQDWNVSSVVNMINTFSSCKALELDCSKWDVSNVTSYAGFNADAPGVILPEAWQTTAE